jgi:ATP-dependent DNA helicase RecG
MPSDLAATSPAPARATARPFALGPLFIGLQTLSGIGAKTIQNLDKLLGGSRIIDLLRHAPIDVIDRSYRPKLNDARADTIATITIEVMEHKPAKRFGLPYRIIGGDGTGFLDLVFFNVKGPYLEEQFSIGSNVTVSGKLEHFQGKWQMAHPDKMNSDSLLVGFEPVYALTAGITNRMLGKFMRSALKNIPDLPEWLDGPLQTREGWHDFATSLKRLHTPESAHDIAPQSIYRQRLAYDELLAGQLAIALVRESERGLKGRSFPTSTDLRAKLLSALPFKLTNAQQRSITEIDKDMNEPLRMMRLLQGDVGSGKTIVAALAMLNAIESGAQAAIMAPTEILAQQHATTLTPVFEKLGIRTIILTGRHKGTERQEILNAIKDGTAQAIIGTHALFQDTIDFYDLGLVVIDEQHRFGVHQRMELTNKGRGTDLLVMTATPIPRTLSLTAYGDLDISKLDEKPPGRKPVDTRLIPLSKFDDLVSRLTDQLKDGVQVYWVCPLVEESEMLDLANATERYEQLSKIFGTQVGLIHGRMKPAEKDAVMAAFAAGTTRLLVATTVIEVGVNVPNATIMVIEHAERYGLSQLHQLRGRVGRGSAQSYCFLLYATPCGATAKERLTTLRDTEDGFVIAEKDLQLRGAGDILGTRQSGLPDYHFADLGVHANLLDIARDDARVFLTKDRDLQTPRGQALRHLLYLHERDRAIRLLHAG